MDAGGLAGTVRQVRASTLEPVELAASGRFTLDDAKEFAQTGVNHLAIEGLTAGGGCFRLALEIFRPRPTLVPPQLRH
jgi:nicotinate-nucleotide pyrophosphorylase